MSRNSGEGAWIRYLRWNQAIADHVYPVGMNGRPAYLQLDDEDISSIAFSLGESVEASDPKEVLRNVVYETLNVNNVEGIFDGHGSAAIDWLVQNRSDYSSKPPPCIALLAVFVMAAERMQSIKERRGNNYYDPLMEELRTPQSLANDLKNHVAAEFRKLAYPVFWKCVNPDLRFGLSYFQ